MGTGTEIRLQGKASGRRSSPTPVSASHPTPHGFGGDFPPDCSLKSFSAGSCPGSDTVSSLRAAKSCLLCHTVSCSLPTTAPHTYTLCSEPPAERRATAEPVPGVLQTLHTSSASSSSRAPAPGWISPAPRHFPFCVQATVPCFPDPGATV